MFNIPYQFHHSKLQYFETAELQLSPIYAHEMVLLVLYADRQNQFVVLGLVVFVESFGVDSDIGCFDIELEMDFGFGFGWSWSRSWR